MKTKDLFLGIDPGLSGAIALVDSRGEILQIQTTPTVVIKKGKGNRTIYVESSMVSILEACRTSGNLVMTGLENVHAMPGQGVTSMFSMGQGFGLWLGIISALRMPYTRIEPMTWKKIMGIPSKSDKRESVVRALQLFPHANLMKTERSRVECDGKADALLIAEYIRRIHVRGSAT
jgi:crossover junction endodeoxyribonuclease RuvC